MAAGVERLVCAEADAAERQAVQAEFQQRRAAQPTARLVPSHVKRRLKAVEAKRKAGPGPSGWRD
eukprot:11202059-Lingulodinium_polyedra.AAC.1